MYEHSDSLLFSPLPERRQPWKEFVFSMGSQGALVIFLVWVGIFHPGIIVQEKRDHQVIALVPTPVPEPQAPAPIKVIRQNFTLPPEPIHTEVLRIAPEIKHVAPPPKPEVPVAPKIEIAAKAPLVPAIAPVIPRKLVKVDNFSGGSSVTPTIAKAPQHTQTGGFGDPNGIPAKANEQGKPANIAQVGAFDLPTGPGQGNGTGGAKGTRGVVASTGFGSGTATGDGSGTVNSTRGTVNQGSFGDAATVAPGAGHHQPDPTPGKMIPAEVLQKPSPVYTDEAKKLRIEGEVLLEVVFQSSGKLRIVRVIRGLGYGLDESATRAAEQIQFKPATRDGQAVDSTAVVHIIFRLA